jgi:SAM-dependent methyltransferase
LELVEPGLLDAESLTRFSGRFEGQLAAAVGSPRRASALASDDSPQMKQRRHFDWFASDTTLSYDEYQRSRFWRAVDAATFGGWTQGVDRDWWVLDVGCANGRSAWPFAVAGATVVGCDISRRLVAQAVDHARRRGLQSTTTFLVADADRLPFATESFDGVVTYGALHHLPNPAQTCLDIQRIVNVGGVHFGSENNKSALRRAFDLLMKVKPLWIEEAGEEPLISERMIRDWLAAAPARVQVATQVFAPPHLINMLPEGWGEALLNVTDAIGRRLPIVQRNGGLIVFSARKTSPYARN